MQGAPYEILNLPEAVAVESTEPVVTSEQPAVTGNQDYLQNAKEVGLLVVVAVAAAIALSAVSDMVRDR